MSTIYNSTLKNKELELSHVPHNAPIWYSEFIDFIVIYFSSYIVVGGSPEWIIHFGIGKSDKTIS